MNSQRRLFFDDRRDRRRLNNERRGSCSRKGRGSGETVSISPGVDPVRLKRARDFERENIRPTFIPF